MNLTERENDARLRRKSYEAYARAYAGAQFHGGLNDEVKFYGETAMGFLSRLENFTEEDRELEEALKSLLQSK